MGKRVYETMTKFVFRDARLTVRVWRECPAPTMGPDDEVVTVLRGVSNLPVHRQTPEAISAALGALDRISAFETLTAGGQGQVIYPNWLDEKEVERQLDELRGDGK